MKRLPWVAMIMAMVYLLAFAVSGMMPDFSFVFSDDTINQMTIDATVNEDGSINVIQTADYVFSTEGNGFFIDFDTDITNITVRENVNGQWVDYAWQGWAANGSRNVYTVNQSTIKIYCPTSDSTENRKFEVCYKILNGAVRYSDTAELYWYAIPKNYEFPIKDLTVNVTTPKDYADFDFNHAFGHSAAAGEVNLIDENHFQFTAASIRDYEPVEIRVLFAAQSLSGLSALDKPRLEQAMSEESVNAQNQDKVIFGRKVAKTLNIFICLLGIAVCVYLYYRYDQEYNPVQKYDYYRELPENVPPAEAAVLWRYKKLVPDDITATIMDLVRQKYLALEEASLRDMGKVRDGLSPHESFLMVWLIDGLGENGVLPMSTFNSASKTENGAEQFINNYNHWKKLVFSATSQRDYFDDQIKGGRLASMIIGFVLIGTFFLLYALSASSSGVIIGKPSILWFVSILALIIYPSAIRRRSKYGSQKYHEWFAFRKFLLDFSNLKEAPTQSVEIWEHYLVYAITLGVAKEVIEQLKVVLPKYYNADPSMPYYYFYTSHTMSSMLNTSISHAITTSNTTIAASRAASGGDGGFTGGGGGGFGGGGGSGRF